MTTELEKQFFSTFGIESREYKSCDVGTFCPYPEKKCGTDTCPYYRTYKVDYPAISDRHYLELICLMSEEAICFVNYSTNVEHLKEYILKEFILDKDFFDKHQVQELFKGNDE